MSQLKLYLFGTPRAELDAIPITLPRRKVIAILTYLARTRQVHRRDALATLFWPESNQSAARGALRRELHMLTQAVGARWFTATRETIALNRDAPIWIDVEAFVELIAAGRAAEATALYQGDFLAGFTLSDCPDFDNWQFFETDLLRREYAQLLESLVHHHEQQNEFDAAITYARRWLALDAMHEPVHCQLMRLFALAGQQAAALRQYDECVRILDQELGVPPDEATTELFEAIRTRTFPGLQRKEETHIRSRPSHSHDATAIPPVDRSNAASPIYHLPAQLTPFIGREDECSAIRQLLVEEETCRLLTLIGSGGIGKTRLAIEAASHLRDHFADGVAFVGLAAVNAVENMVTAIAESIGYTFSGGLEPALQLRNYLRSKQLLLVVDNLEHLLAGVEHLSELLVAAPGVKMLTTSREVLGLQEEWIYHVGGLAVPMASAPYTAVAQNAAIQIFLQKARQANANFVLNDEAVPFVVRICQAVDGMPLGIELAAAWVQSMSVHEIAKELTQNFDILTTATRNVPERHRSLRIIFEQSWQGLNEQEQAILKRLAVFRGSFSREAAQQLTNGSLFHLSSLVDKSLCRYAAGHYEMHELLRQFAFGHLTPDEVDTVQFMHAQYFGTLLKSQQPHIATAKNEEFFQTIAHAFDNVLAAWHYLTERLAQHDQTAQSAMVLQDYLPVLSAYCQQRSLYHEGLRIFTKTLALLPPPSTTLPQELQIVTQLRRQLQLEQALLFMPIGRYQEAIDSFLALLPAFSANAENAALADLLTGLSVAYRHLGEFAEAERHATRALTLYEQLAARKKSVAAFEVLGSVKYDVAQYKAARHYFRQLLAIHEELGYEAGIARAMNSIGVAYEWDGDLDQAILHYERGYRLALRSNNRGLLAVLVSKLAHCAHLAGDYEEALEKHQAATDIFRENGNVHWLADQLTEMAEIQLERDELTVAKGHLCEALTLVQQHRQPLVGIRVLAITAWFLFSTGTYPLAVSIASFAMAQEHLQHRYRGICEEVLLALRKKMTETTYTTAEKFGHNASFIAIVDDASYALASSPSPSMTDRLSSVRY